VAPTRQRSGEGRIDSEEPSAGARDRNNQQHGSSHRGSEHGMSGRQSASVGEARDGRRGRGLANAIGKDGGPSGSRRGSEVPRKPGNAGGGKGPHFGRRLRRREGAVIGE
jgi:hypothetical protein